MDDDTSEEVEVRMVKDSDFIKKLKNQLTKGVRDSMLIKRKKRVLKTKFENSDKKLRIKFGIL